MREGRAASGLLNKGRDVFLPLEEGCVSAGVSARGARQLKARPVSLVVLLL